MANRCLKIVFSALLGYGITFDYVLAQATIPSGRAITLTELVTIFEDFAGFLLLAGEVIAAIVVIWAGIAYMAAGADTAKITAAKNILKAGLIGALIVFGTGVIINTIKNFGSGPDRFFR